MRHLHQWCYALSHFTYTFSTLFFLLILIQSNVLNTFDAKHVTEQLPATDHILKKFTHDGFSFDPVTALALWFIVTAWGRFQGMFSLVSSKGPEHSWCASKGIGTFVVNIGVSACQPFGGTQWASNNLEYVLLSINF